MSLQAETPFGDPPHRSNNSGPEALKPEKTASIRGILKKRRLQQSDQQYDVVFGSSDGDGGEFDSAIVEDDEEERTDSNSPDEQHGGETNWFTRVNSPFQLTTQRSMLTAALTHLQPHKSSLDRTSESSLAPCKSQFSSVKSLLGESSCSRSETKDDDQGMMVMSRQVDYGSQARSIDMTTSNTYAVAHSPGQKRYSVANLQRSSSAGNNGRLGTGEQNTDASNWNHYFDSASDYHSRGW